MQKSALNCSFPTSASRLRHLRQVSTMSTFNCSMLVCMPPWQALVHNLQQAAAREAVGRMAEFPCRAHFWKSCHKRLYASSMRECHEARLPWVLSAKSRSWSAFSFQPFPVTGGTAGDEPTTSGPVGCKGRFRMGSLSIGRMAYCVVLSS